MNILKAILLFAIFYTITIIPHLWICVTITHAQSVKEVCISHLIGMLVMLSVAIFAISIDRLK
jgi:hypothetical protein